MAAASRRSSRSTYVRVAGKIHCHASSRGAEGYFAVKAPLGELDGARAVREIFGVLLANGDKLLAQGVDERVGQHGVAILWPFPLRTTISRDRSRRP